MVATFPGLTRNGDEFTAFLRRVGESQDKSRFSGLISITGGSTIYLWPEEETTVTSKTGAENDKEGNPTMTTGSLVEEQKEVVRQFFQRFAAGDIAGVIALFRDDASYWLATTRETLVRELKHKIFWEAVAVAAHCLVEAFGGYLVETGKIRIKHNLLSADKVNR